MKRIFCVILVFSLCIQSAAFAGALDVEKNNDVISICGNAGVQGINLTLLMTEADIREGSYMDILCSDKTIFVDQQRSGVDGQYEFKADISRAKVGRTVYIWVYNSESGELLGASAINLDNSISDREKAQWDANLVSIEYNGRDDYIVLPQTAGTACGYGSILSWSCSDGGVTIEDGKAYVDRAVSGGKKIVLTVFAEINSAKAQKSFEFTVHVLGDEEIVEKEKADLELDTENILDKIILPQTGKYGCRLEWSMTESNEFLSFENGVLLIDNVSIKEDITARLKCKIIKNDCFAEKEFELTISALSEMQKAQIDIDSIEISYNGTDSSFALPKSGSVYNSKITWKSSDYAVIEPLNGIAAVNRTLLTNDRIIVLTATINSDNILSREFNITVKKGSGNYSGGSQSGGGGNAMSYPTKYSDNTSEKNTETISDEGKTLFNDLGDYGWAADSIKRLCENGVINGMGDGSFAPGQCVTRAQFLKMLVVLFDLKHDSSNMHFSDVSKDDWCFDYVAAGVNNGIVNGIEDNIFGKDSFITRQDMAVMIYRCVGREKQTIENAGEFYDDSCIAEYAREAVYYLKGLDVIKGNESGIFNPGSFATRAEATVMLARCEQLR